MNLYIFDSKLNINLLYTLYFIIILYINQTISNNIKQYQTISNNISNNIKQYQTISNNIKQYHNKYIITNQIYSNN
jgi:hypothetical protein